MAFLQQLGNNSVFSKLLIVLGCIVVFSLATKLLDRIIRDVSLRRSMSDLRSPNEFLPELLAGIKGEADIDVIDVVWEVIEDVMDSFRLALSQDERVTSETVDDVLGTVEDYIPNHYDLIGVDKPEVLCMMCGLDESFLAHSVPTFYNHHQFVPEPKPIAEPSKRYDWIAYDTTRDDRTDPGPHFGPMTNEEANFFRGKANYWGVRLPEAN